ncbi:MAG: hypothetical protein EB007_00775 [Betaproteobacteria bacterium]|nr:hypothetical protein [Betaproteobacteria bacterium]
MAIVEVKVPQLSESVAEATLLQWKKKVGESVLVDEILTEIETDKVVLEVPAPSAGVLCELLVGDGATVMAEQLIARIDTQGHAAGAAAGATAALKTVPPAAPMAGVAMPAAAKLMADKQLAAGSVAGTGRDGRITKGDVLSAAAAVQSTPPELPAAVQALPDASFGVALLPEVAMPLTWVQARSRRRHPGPSRRMPWHGKN